MSSNSKLYQSAVANRTDIALSRNSRLSEFIVSDTATKKGIDNWPQRTEIVYRLHLLVLNALQPIRDHYNKPLIITSGYRSPALNKALGGSTTSYHVEGYAADFEIYGVSNRELAKWINKNLVFHELILEFFDSTKGKNSGWIHLAYMSSGNKKEFLIASRQSGNNSKVLYKKATPAELNAL